ncbi:MAG TPA: MMPL family transporter [Solirubrobacterales bacterium]|nr:MMPL family transporter [Solirubrobacterales bacterium]
MVLIGFGVGLEARLSPSTIEIPATPASRADAMLRESFGDTALFPILLRGPEKAIDRQGPALIKALHREPGVTTLSPWSAGSFSRLRPGPRRALILADFHTSLELALDQTVPHLEHLLAASIHPPVRATQTGFPTVSKAIQEESIGAAEQAELIALPILAIVLLLVLRSLVAALVPLGFGVVAVLSSRGVLAILAHWVSVDAVALTVCTMMGLALGVDYALLMVFRFREELARGADPVEAAWVTRRRAGRTAAFAGGTLALSMMVAFFVLPGALLASLAGTLVMVVLLTVVIAVLVVAPMLALLGANIDRWRIGPTGRQRRSRLLVMVSAALERPALVAALIGGTVLALAAPTLALKMGPFSASQLSGDDPVRRDAEVISRSVGRGFEAPFTIVVTAREGTITEPDRLARLSRWQRRLSDLPGVQSVIGPRQVASAVAPLRRAGRNFLGSDREPAPLANLDRLGHGLDRAVGGVASVRAGLARAAYVDGRLAKGSSSAKSGALKLARGIDRAALKGRQSLAGVGEFATGSRRLAAGLARAANGTLLLKLSLPALVSNPRQNALPQGRRLVESLGRDGQANIPQLQGGAQVVADQLEVALQELSAMTVERSDPHYVRALEAVGRASTASSGFPLELSALQARLGKDESEAKEMKRWLESTVQGIDRAAAVARKLSDGLGQIKIGSEKLARGAARIERESERLIHGLGLFDTGAKRLTGGLARISAVATGLEEGLGKGFHRSRLLQAGLRRGARRVTAQATSANRQVERVRHVFPGLLGSGYLALTALDGTRRGMRERAGEVIALEDGGRSAALLVVSRFPFNSPGSVVFNERLESEARALERQSDLSVGVAGFPSTLNTYSRVTEERIPYVVAAITLATFLVLVLVLRAVPLAALAVGLNLVTVGVAFGVLTLLTNLPSSVPLGGHEYIDAVGANTIFGIVFGLSIDYAVFLLVRMREHYDRHGDSTMAIQFGLERTARVVTGAAAIMMAVFVAFAGAPIATVSQLGIGLTVAVLLDATVIRIVLLPALMLLAGDRIWWLPRWLDRMLPRLTG